MPLSRLSSSGRQRQLRGRATVCAPPTALHLCPPSCCLRRCRWEGLLTGGSYANCPSDTYGAEEAVRKYYGSNLCRLVAAKRTYDPSNLFAYEQGVPLQAAECDE